MSINKSLLKRIKAVESELCMNLQFAPPSLIWVGYDTQKEVYTIKEQYMNDKGKIVKVCNYEYVKLKEYVFHPDFDGTCFFDLFNAPVPEPNLYVVQGRELRKEVEKGEGITIDFEVEQEEHNSPITVNVDVCGVVAVKK